MDRKELMIKNVQRWPRQLGKAEYLRFLKGERLTRNEAIQARCYECVQGEDTRPCRAATCAITLYCQWNKVDEGAKVKAPAGKGCGGR